MARDHFYEVKKVAISALQLDAYNPRIRHGQDQNDCIARILRDRENFLNLLKDIAAHGLSPEHILVSKSAAGKWIVRDGNRRVTALKLLNRPNLALPDNSLMTLVARIRDAHADNIPKKLNCLACDDEEEISAYLERKHTGTNAGIGQKSWSALLKSLFNLHAGISDQNRRAAQLLLWAEEQGMQIDDDYPITTLVRGLNADTLKLIGFTIENDAILPSIDVGKAYAMAEQVINDIAQGRIHVKRDTDEGSIFTKTAQLKYFKSVRDSFADLADAPSQPPRSTIPNRPLETEQASPIETPPDEPRTNSPIEESPVRRQPSAAKPSWDRSCLFGKRPHSAPGFIIPDTEPKAISVVAELRRLNPSATPIACAMLLRYLIELSNTHYRQANNLSINQNESLHRSIANSSEHMKVNGRIADAEHNLILRYTRDEESMLHIKTLQAYIHKPNFHPNGQAINTFWDEIGCFVKACWC